MAEAKSPSEDILCINFNLNYTCFACGTNTGFAVYNANPYKEVMKRNFGGGIGHIEMLYQTNILALVGGGRNPHFPPNKVIIWDDRLQKGICELSFRSIVNSVKLKRDRIVVVLEHKICIYNFADVKLIEQIETIQNPLGLCLVCPEKTKNIVACPTTDPGNIKVELYDTKVSHIINAHKNEIVCMTMNQDGSLIASASSRGTLVRVFETATGKKIHEFRRGLDTAQIKSMCFDSNSQFLVVASNKETLHLFSLRSSGGDKDKDKDKDKDNISNTVSRLSYIKDYLPGYFSSEWSYKQIKIPNINENKIVVGFSGKDNSLIIVTANGCYYHVTFNGEEPILGQKYFGQQ